MSIPFWREKDPTDDGCSIYQCLSCYGTWEARTSPQREGWKTGFIYCPCCGIKWQGEIPVEEWDHEFYNKQQEIDEKRNVKKHWWVLVLGAMEDSYLSAHKKVEAGGIYSSKTIRKWMLAQKEFYSDKCYSRYDIVKFVLSKDLEKDFPYDRYIRECHLQNFEEKQNE